MNLDFKWLHDFAALNGAALYLAVLVMLVFLLIVLVVVARYYFPDGNARLEGKQENEREAIAVLKGQLLEQRQLHKEQREEDAREIRGLQDRMASMEERMAVESEWNREYRHRMANREHLLGFAYDYSLMCIDAIIDEYPQLPEHFIKQRAQMRGSDELRASLPLPTLLEIEERYRAMREEGHS